MVTTRTFGPSDSVTIWDLLNEIKGWVDSLSSSGVAARYWAGTLPATKSLGDGKNVSINMSSGGGSGGITPTWDGDTFKLPAGKYRIDIQLRFDQSSGGYRSAALMRNPGVTTYNSDNSPPGNYLRSAQFATSSNDTTVQMTKILSVSATDVFMIIARQTSGSTTPILANPQDSELMIQRIGD